MLVMTEVQVITERCNGTAHELDRYREGCTEVMIAQHSLKDG